MDNPQAYPCLDSSCGELSLREPDMTLRDYFAGQALTGYIAHLGARGIGAGCYIRECAAESYQIADTMLAERSKATKETSDA